jgi:hypothetical protein
VKVSRVDLETTRIDFVLAEFGGRRESIPDELSILPDKYRAETKAKSGAKPTAKKTDKKLGAREVLTAKNPWDAERKPKTTRAKKASATKNRGHGGKPSVNKTGANKSSAKKSDPKRSK